MTDRVGNKAINGLSMYYEIHGNGAPLVLLHGAFATADMYSALVPELSQKRQVILVEQQGHGHTADIDRPLSFATMADDTAALLTQLGVDQADIFGYSAGATVALQLAVRHPECVVKLALASAVYDACGYLPGIMDGIKNMSPDALPAEMRAAYEKVAPHPEDWAQLVHKSAAMAKANDVQDILTADQLRGIQVPVLLVVSDRDIVRSEYADDMAKLLHSERVIVSGDHASYIVENPRELLDRLNVFFSVATEVVE